MGKRLQIVTTFFILASIAALLSWHSSLHMIRVYRPIKVGVTAGPHFAIMNLVKTIVAKDGIDLQIVVFTDYSKLNESLHRGEISLNSFQNQPYLDRVLDDHNYAIVPIAKTFLLPMGIYAKKIHNLSALPTGSKVAIPQDLWNGSRALLLLEKAGLIVCRKTTDSLRTLDDIVENPKNLSFIQMDATQITSMIDKVDIVLINANYAAKIDLLPTKDALALEDIYSPYVNLLVAGAKNINHKDLEKIVTAYQSQEIKTFVDEHFQGTVITAW
ncbi:MetQ/NlpA family ABC transporter substrate-binding protein [Pelosinus baikalensis]|uniref:Lipoprotein n=1 Tax=Pelosinus baikalensis TaxID=2892015 RepID=A0ABS8HPP9_9FIRM|nr:MetQ/NlpA family ABC transporter substrate-binding protein [Pelosinus baikalensis]MCC5465180.1 MetQ/NlpA family ABC transporter substrate-binding protein [Pelosinus baikalensis]MCC5465205.1 MetQ/NlpA family ABC transporter substrate-binding protein [Pelosinus baikalensis]